MKIPKLCRNGDGRAFSIIPKSGGKREYFGEYGSEAANRKHREWVTRLLNSEGLLFQEKRQSEYYITELVALYLDHWKPKLTKKQYGLMWKNLERLIRLCGSELGINLGPKTLIQYQQLMSKEEYQHGNKTKRYTRGTINKSIRQVKEFVKWCCKLEYLPPEHHLKLTAVENLRQGEYDIEDPDPVQPITFKTMKDTLPYFSKMIRVMVQVQYYCGMRPGEVCRLNWGEIDQTEDVWLYVPLHHKTKHRNWKLMKAIPYVAQVLLLSDPNFKRGEYVFDPTVAGKCKSHPYKYYSPQGYGSSVAYGVKKAIEAGAISEPWTPNQLRHAIATDIRRFAGYEAAQDYLGHASLNTTQIYAERTRERIINIARQLQTNLFGGDTDGERDEELTEENRDGKEEVRTVPCEYP